MSDRFDLFGRYVVEVRGDGESVNRLRKTFDHFATRDTGQDADIVCELTRERPDPEVVFGEPDEYYGREGDRFVIKKPDGYGFMSIDSEWNHVALSPDIDHYLVAYLIEFEVRKRLASEGYALVHASSAQIDDTALVFPAWRSTGKTNTLLTLLEAGADYLSDDRLWIGTDGTALGYPVPLNMMPSNIETFPGLSAMTPREKQLSRVSDELYDRIDQDRSFVDKAAYFATKFYIDPDLGRQLVSLDELMPNSKFVAQTDLDNVVMLRTQRKSPNNRVKVDEITADEALADHRAINNFEWNAELREYYTAYDAMFSDGTKSEELDAVIDAEEQNLSEIFADLPTYRAHIPREQDWTSTGIASDLVEKFRALGSETRTVNPPQ